MNTKKKVMTYGQEFTIGTKSMTLAKKK